MTKSEKNALADVIAILNAIVNRNDETVNSNGGDDKTNHQPVSNKEENPSDEEIEFVRKIANDQPFSIAGYGIKFEEGTACDIIIGKTCLGHMITAYLEKYCHD